MGGWGPCFEGTAAAAQRKCTGGRCPAQPASPHARSLPSSCLPSSCPPRLHAGPILAQAVVPVYPTDRPDQLAARVLKEEHKLYPG